MPSVKTKGINLRSVKVGEADKIITIFTENLGKISAIAKGARKPSSKFGGRLEPFSFNEYLLGTGKSLYIVSQVETIENFYELREDEDKLASAGGIVRLLDAAVEDCHKDPALLQLALLSLRLLKEGVFPSTVKKIFEIRLMEMEGFFPLLDGCVKCKRKIVKEPEEVNINLIMGGLTCSACSKTVMGGITVPYELVRLVLKIRSAGVEELKKINIEPGDIEKLDMIFKPYISDHIGKDIRNW